jgi:hypothetical protein
LTGAKDFINLRREAPAFPMPETIFELKPGDLRRPHLGSGEEL